MNIYENRGIDWIVAVLAPWTISPHPNFSQKVISPAAQLALVTEKRFTRESERYGPENVDRQSDWQGELVSQAEASLVDETQAASTRRLWTLADSASIPFGARAAAALYGSVGSTEMEESNFAEVRLSELIEEFTANSPEPADAPASLRLIIAALSQQRVARLFDSQQFSGAQVAVAQTLNWVPPAGDRGFDDFPVSKGIAWRAARVQDDIARSIRYHALNARVSLEFPDAKSWVSVVKSRAGWVDMRTSRLAGERDSLVLRDKFEAKFESTSGTRHMMRQSAVESGYAALLVSELSGFVGRINGDRENLGKIVMLERGSAAGSAREAIRLLRQGRGSKTLQSVLSTLRNQGPTAALTDDAKKIIKRVQLHGWTTEADLHVLGASADFITTRERKQAIEASLRVLETEQLGRYVGWSIHDRVWKTLVQLLPDSDADAFVLEKMTAYLNTPDYISQPFTSTLARAILALEWTDTRAQDRTRWENWAAETLETAETRELQRAVRAAQASGDEMVPTGLNLERAAFLADNGLPAGVDATELELINDVLVKSLRAEADQARKGMYSFGGYNTANVAVAYAMRFPDDELWNEVVAFLLDDNIDAVLKADSLDRLARFLEDVPERAQITLSSGYESLLNTKREDHFFASTSLPVFAEAVRLTAALHALPPDRALSFAMELAAGDDVARTEAAKTIPYIMESADSTWGHSLLLQLSHDKNSVVRAEAASSLVLSLHFESALLETVKLRIKVLLHEDGVRTPALMLHAIRRQSEERPGTIYFLASMVEGRASADSPRLIRRIADDTLSAIRESRTSRL
jgi:hypothetical protein